MKKIYFVRHGESEGNANLIVQTHEAQLTEKGMAQASVVAGKCIKLEFETIISSTMIRARQTAEIISAATKKPIELSNLFVERRRPKEISGKHIDDAESVRFRKAIRENIDINFRFSNEENFSDLRNRAHQAMEFLKNHKEENILVVTHGLFLRMIAAYVFFGEKMTGHECQQLFWKLAHTNTGITLIEFNDEDNSLILKTWNDHAHLG